MAKIFYVDYEGSAGTGDGSSFANRAHGIESLTNYGQYNLWSSQSPNGSSQPSDGYEIRIKSSPLPTQVSTGCKIVKRAADSKSGYDRRSTGTLTYSTTTGATSMNWNSHKLVTGDWVILCNNTQYHTSNSFDNRMGINGRWKVTVTDDNNFTLDDYTAPNATVAGGSRGNWWCCSGAVVELPSSGADKWKPVACTDAKRVKWVASSNVNTYDPYYDVSTWSETWNLNSMMSDYIEITNSFTTGKVAYYTLPSTLDLSGFQQLSWMVGTNQGERQLRSNGDHGFSFRLCSDTTGDTTVDTLPWEGDWLNNSNYWHAMVRDKGSNFGSSIRSIALYLDERVDSYNGAYYFHMHNIVACKASSADDSVTHRSLIGKNTTAMKSWYRISELGNHKEIGLAHCMFHRRRPAQSYYSSGDAVWWDAGGSNVTIWKREPHMAVPYNTPTEENKSGGYQFDFSKINGPSGWNGFALISGGWNTTDMTSQVTDGSGEAYTCIDWVGQNGGWSSSSGGGPHRIKDIFFLSAYYGPYLTSTEGMLDNTGHHQCYGGNGIKCSWNQHSGIGMRQYSHNYNNQIVHHSLKASAWNRTYFAPSGPVWYIKQASCVPYNQNNGQISMSNSWKYSNEDGVSFDYINVEHCVGAVLGGSADSRINTFVGGYPFVRYGDYSCYMAYHMGGGIGSVTIHSQNGIRYNTGAGLSPVVIDSYTQDIYDADNGQLDQYTWYNGTPDYSIRMDSNAGPMTINDGEIDKRAYVYGNHLTLNGVINNDSNAHYLYGTGQISIKNANDVQGANTYYATGYTIEPETTIRNTNSGTAWKFSSTDSSITGSYEVAKFAVASGGTAAVKVYMYKGGAIGGIKIVKNGDIGMTGDVVTENTTDSSSTWIQKTAYIQPSAAGIITVQLTIRGGSGYVVFDDMSITQS